MGAMVSVANRANLVLLYTRNLYFWDRSDGGKHVMLIRMQFYEPAKKKPGRFWRVCVDLLFCTLPYPEQKKILSLTPTFKDLLSWLQICLLLFTFFKWIMWMHFFTFSAHVIHDFVTWAINLGCCSFFFGCSRCKFHTYACLGFSFAAVWCNNRHHSQQWVPRVILCADLWAESCESWDPCGCFCCFVVVSNNFFVPSACKPTSIEIISTYCTVFFGGKFLEKWNEFNRECWTLLQQFCRFFENSKLVGKLIVPASWRALQPPSCILSLQPPFFSAQVMYLTGWIVQGVLPGSFRRLFPSTFIVLQRGFFL